MACVALPPTDLANVGVKNTFIDVAEFAPPETTELRRAQTCPEKPKRMASGLDLPVLAEEEDASSPQSQVVTPKIPGLTARSLSTSNFVEDYDVDLTPVHSPEPFGLSEFSQRQTPKGVTSPRFAATPDATPLVAPMETQIACRQLLASFEQHFGGPMVLDQPMQAQPMQAMPMQAASNSPPSSMPPSPEAMMQQQPLQMQPMQMQQQQMQQQQMQQQPMQQQQQQPMMMMMPVVKLQMSAQQNNSPQYPNSFQQNAGQMPVVPLHQMGYPTYPPVNSSAPNRTPPVPGEQAELDPERAKWKAAWEEEENKQRWAEWEDMDFARRRPRRRRTRRVEPVIPESGCKVFVGGLGPQTTSLTLRAYFSQYGRVLDAAVLADSETKRSRGFGFVDFAGEIPAAVLEQEHVIEQRRCGVRKYEYTPQGTA